MTQERAVLAGGCFWGMQAQTSPPIARQREQKP